MAGVNVNDETVYYMDLLARAARRREELLISLQQQRSIIADLQRDGRIRAEESDQRQVFDDGVICDLRESLQWQRDDNAVLRGTVGRLEDTIEALLGYTECGCGEDEEGRYGKCVPCLIRDEGIYP